jgi:hypothetical protein
MPTPHDAGFAVQMQATRDTMNSRRNVLRELAKQRHGRLTSSRHRPRPHR